MAGSDSGSDDDEEGGEPGAETRGKVLQRHKRVRQAGGQRCCGCLLVVCTGNRLHVTTAAVHCTHRSCCVWRLVAGAPLPSCWLLLPTIRPPPTHRPYFYRSKRL